MLFYCLLILIFIILCIYNFYLLLKQQDNTLTTNLELQRTVNQPIIPYNTSSFYVEQNAIDCLFNVVKCNVNNPTSCFLCDGTNYICKHFNKNLRLEVYSTSVSKPKRFHSIQKNKSNDEGYCVKEKSCNPYTSIKTMVKLSNGSVDTVCVCKYPSLVNKSNFFSDCNLIVGCSPDGKLTNKNNKDKTIEHKLTSELNFDPYLDGRCECPDGYKNIFSPKNGPECSPARINDLPSCFEHEYLTENKTCKCSKGFVCTDDVITIKKSGYFMNVASMFDRPQCIRRPCQWDPVEPNDYNSNNYFSENVGCVCDYANGWIGMREEEFSKSLNKVNNVNTNHYNRCVHIANPKTHTHTSVTYFYTKRGIYTKHMYFISHLKKWFQDIVKNDENLFKTDVVWLVEDVFNDENVFHEECYYMNSLKKHFKTNNVYSTVKITRKIHCSSSTESRSVGAILSVPCDISNLFKNSDGAINMNVSMIGKCYDKILLATDICLCSMSRGIYANVYVFNPKYKTNNAENDDIAEQNVNNANNTIIFLETKNRLTFLELNRKVTFDYDEFQFYIQNLPKPEDA